MKPEEAVNYLTNVLNNWTEFCATHRVFALAIRTLLTEYVKLKRQNKP